MFHSVSYCAIVFAEDPGETLAARGGEQGPKALPTAPPALAVKVCATLLTDPQFLFFAVTLHVGWKLCASVRSCARQ